MNTARIGTSKRELESLKAYATRQRKDGRPLIEDPRFRDKLSRLEIELTALTLTNLRFLDQLRGGRPPGAEVSMLKIKGTEIQQSLTELMMQAAGPLAQMASPGEDADADARFAASLGPRYLNFRKTTIYAGSNEIQRNIIAKRVLGPVSMNFDRTEEQHQLAASIARFVERDYDFATRRRIVASAEGWSRAAWRTMAELGLLGLPLPAEFGGFGGGAVDTMAVMEAIGDRADRRAVPPDGRAGRTVRRARRHGGAEAADPAGCRRRRPDAGLRAARDGRALRCRARGHPRDKARGRRLRDRRREARGGPWRCRRPARRVGAHRGRRCRCRRHRRLPRRSRRRPGSRGAAIEPSTACARRTSSSPAFESTPTHSSATKGTDSR